MRERRDMPLTIDLVHSVNEGGNNPPLGAIAHNRLAKCD